MPRVTIDFSEAQSRKPIPDGQYPATIEEVSGPHKGEKSHYLTWVLKISEGEFEGRKFFHNTPINGAGASILGEFLTKVTGDEIDVDKLQEMDLDTDDYIGAALGIITKQSEYPKDSGDMRSEIKKILSAR